MGAVGKKEYFNRFCFVNSLKNPAEVAKQSCFWGCDALSCIIDDAANTTKKLFIISSKFCISKSDIVA